MSNYDLKYQLYCSKRASSSREANLAVDLHKAIQAIKSDGNLWNVEWRGMIFSIKPFLCSALSFIHIEELFDILCTCIAYSDEDFYDKLLDIKREDYYGTFTKDENNVCNSILYQFSSQVPCVTRYLVGLDDIRVAKQLMSFLIKEFTYVYSDETAYIEFKDNDICNTEAFSYFISIYWALQKSKKLQLLLVKEIKIQNFQDLLIKLCPESSLHYKYLSGEITSEELHKGFVYGDDSNSPILFKELFNLLSKSSREYDEEKDKAFLTEFCSNLSINFNYEDFIRTMACGYMTMDFYKRDKLEAKQNLKAIDDLKARNSSLDKENKQLKSSLKSLTKERNKLSSKVSSLVDKNDSSRYEERIKDLDSIIYDLKSQISVLERKLDSKESEILHQKQVIRSQIKELKSLNARLDEAEQVSEDFEEEIVEDEPQFSISEMASSLKGFKLGVFGGFDAGNLVEKFKDYGLTVKHVIDDKQFIVGDLDCAIVLTSNVQHKTVKRLKAQYNGNFVYFNGTCIELMIQEVFNVLCKEI